MKNMMHLPRLIKDFSFLHFSWFEWLIILIVLFLSAQVNTLKNSLPLTLLIMLVGGIGFGLLAMRNMPLALTLVLLISATSGITIGTGRTTPLPAGLLMISFLAAIWLYRMILVERQIKLKPSPLNLPLLAFLISAMISWLLGYVIWDWRLVVEKNILIVQAGQYALFLFSFVAMFLTAHQNFNERDLKRWMMIVIGIGLAEMAAELILGIYIGRNNGITGSVLVFPIILLAAQMLFNPQLKSWERIAIIAVVSLWLVFAYSNRVFKGIWVPTLIGLAVLALVRSWKLSLLGAVALGIVAWLKWDYLLTTLYLPEVQGTSTIRPLIWQDIAGMVLPRSPFFGLGLANYFYYWNIPSLIPLSRIAAGWDTWNAWGYAIPSHNMFVDIFAQTGIIGLGLFLWGMAAALWVVIKVIRQLKPGFMRAYALGIFAGFSAMLAGSFLFADWLIPFVYNITITGFSHSVYTWILLGSVLGLYYRMKEEKGLEYAA
jgi:O-antigen ligase